MISRVLQAEPGGEPLTDAEFNNFFAVLMIAGQEASRHSISQGVLALMERPDQFGEAPGGRICSDGSGG